MTTISATLPSGTPAAAGTGGSAPAAAPANAYNNLGENDFLKLLTTQLSHQDPTNPVDNTQMLAQLAQFSTLAAANTTNTDLSAISGQITKATGAPGVAAA